MSICSLTSCLKVLLFCNRHTPGAWYQISIHFFWWRRPSATEKRQIDSSANSALKEIAFLTLSIVTIVSLLCLSSNLPAYLGSTLMKIMPISGCYGFRFVVQIPPGPLHAKHLPRPPRPRCILCKSLPNPLTTRTPHCAHCLHFARRVGFCHHPALSNFDSCCPLHKEQGKSRAGLSLSNLSASCESERPC